MTYEQAIEKIHSLLTFGSRPGLDRMRIFLEKLGNPQDKLKYIHIAVRFVQCFRLCLLRQATKQVFLSLRI